MNGEEGIAAWQFPLSHSYLTWQPALSVLLGKPCHPLENAIKFLRIQNFKSIKDITLHPRRVNLIIGEPNVGKSNLLEAMTLLASFDLPTTLPGFIDIVKDEDAEDNPRLIKLLRAIKQAQPAAYRELAEFVADVMDRNSKLWR